MNIWVSEGSLDSPFYSFYTDAGGTSELQKLILDPSKSYIFRRLNEAMSHPFYLKADSINSDGTSNYSLMGNGSNASGIKGDESFTLSFSDPNKAPASLIGYCTTHPSMQTTWSINLSTEPQPEPTPDPQLEPENYEPPATENEVKGTKKNDDLNGTKKSDDIDGRKGDDTLTGKKGNDILNGGGGQDVLTGSKGSDYLDGSKGIDILNGGKGADVFQISKGTDLIEDFSIKQGDRIALDKKGQYSIIDDPDGVLVIASAKKQLLLAGVDINDILAEGVDLFVQVT